jgi:hypothetical protein
VRSPLAPLCVLAAAVGSAQSGEEILARVANTTSKRHAISYSGLREYRLRNFRFDKEAVVIVQETYRPGEGNEFTVVERSGSPKLIGIVEKLLGSEAEASRPEKGSDHGINPANYEAQLRGSRTIAGRVCYVLDLTAKHKSKYLINGTLWVDPASYSIVRLEGSTAASVSMWIGAPQIAGDYSEIDGLWLPNRTRSVSSGMLLGISELEIRYTGYQVIGADHTVATRATGCHSGAGLR